MLAEAAYEVAAIREAGLLADKGQVMVGEKQIFLGLEYPHSLDVLLAAHAVLLAELRRKAGIAHMAHRCDLRDPDILAEAAVDVLGHVLDAEDIRAPHGAAVDVQPGVYPQPDYAEDQPVYLRPEHDVAPVEVLLCLPDAVGEDLLCAEGLGLPGVEVYLHIL